MSDSNLTGLQARKKEKYVGQMIIGSFHVIGDISIRQTISSDPNTDQMEDFLSREQSVLVSIPNQLKLKFGRNSNFGDILPFTAFDPKYIDDFEYMLLNKK